MILIFSLALLLIPDPPPAALPPEAEAAVERVRKQLADESRPIDQRASIALDEAAALDKMAGAATSGDERRGLSRAAVAILDGFNADHPRHALSTAVALQAGVYVWADGRRDLDAWRVGPVDDPGKARALGRLDDAVDRLGRLEPELSGADPLIAQNARFRLAQALADRATLDSTGSDAARGRLDRALAALDPVPSEPSIAGHARLLRGEIQARLGRFEAAGREVEAAARLKFPPPVGAVVDLRTNVLIGQGRAREAIAAIDASGLDPVARGVLAVRARLAERGRAASNRERREAEADLFSRARTLRDSPRADARLALNDLAREVATPDGSSDPDAFETLADGALGLGDSARAGRLLAEGGDRAGAIGRPDEAGRLRLKAGAILFRAGDFAGADAPLGRVWDDPRSGASRPKAGLLRALARGQALARKLPGATRSAYLAALRDLVRSYPDDPATGEARWLLGTAEVEDGKADEAVKLWTAIPIGHPRWLASRLAIAVENRRTLDESRIGDEPARVRESYRRATAFLRRSATEASSPSDVVELDLESVRLDLTPGPGRPDVALDLCERLIRRPGTDDQKARARTLRVTALAMAGRFAEAEKAALVEAAKASADALLLAIRPLDRAAAETESDVQRVRYGQILRILADGLLNQVDTLPTPLVAETRLRAIRSLVLAGQVALARRALSGPNPPDPDALDADGLRDLADTLVRLEAYGLAVDIERLRIKGLKPASPSWFEARYGLALALYKSQKRDEARRVIDSTAILHADLGGARLREKFERLRRRIDAE